MTGPALPSGACDTHVHVFRPDIYPYARDRAYTPGRITTEELTAFLDAHGLERVVVVQPSVYGTDNRTLLDALSTLGSRARGIAVVDCERVTDNELAHLQSAGCTGIRLNIATRKMTGLSDAVEQAARALAGSSLSIQIYAPLPDIVVAAPTLRRIRQPLILDHFGGARTTGSALPTGTDVLTDLARNGPAYVKISAACRVSDGGAPGWPDVEPLARHLIAHLPGRIVWGSDWPHTGTSRRSERPPGGIDPFDVVDDGLALEKLREWAGDDATARRILVETPAELYRY